MNKKIALLLIIFMVGSWCVFADDGDDEMSMGTILLVVLGVAFVVTMVLIFTGNSEAANSVWEDTTGQSILGYEDKAENEIPTPAITILDNPIVKHGALGFDKDKVFVGLRFAW